MIPTPLVEAPPTIRTVPDKTITLIRQVEATPTIRTVPDKTITLIRQVVATPTIRTVPDKTITLIRQVVAITHIPRDVEMSTHLDEGILPPLRTVLDAAMTPIPRDVGTRRPPLHAKPLPTLLRLIVPDVVTTYIPPDVVTRRTLLDAGMMPTRLAVAKTPPIPAITKMPTAPGAGIQILIQAAERVV